MLGKLLYAQRYKDLLEGKQAEAQSAIKTAAAALDTQLAEQIEETKEQGREYQRQYKDLYNQSLIQEQINKNQARESLAQLGLSDSGYANALYSGINQSTQKTVANTQLAEQKTLKALSDAIVNFREQNRINKINSEQSILEKAQTAAESEYNKERTKALKTDFSKLTRQEAFNKIDELNDDYSLLDTEVDKLLESLGLSYDDYDKYLENQARLPIIKAQKEQDKIFIDSVGAKNHRR